MLITSNPQFPAGPTQDPACQTWQAIPEQRGPGGGLPSERSLNSATGQLQWPWANVVIERLLAHIGYCYPHHIAFATVGTGSSSNSLHSSKAPTAKLTDIRRIGTSPPRQAAQQPTTSPPRQAAACPLRDKLHPSRGRVVSRSRAFYDRGTGILCRDCLGRQPGEIWTDGYPSHCPDDRPGD